MDKELKRATVLVNKIVKNFKRNDLDWTVQLSVSSIHPDKVSYCAQIEAPANGLQPLTWVKGSWKELEDALKLGEKSLNQDEVDKAYYKSEIERAKQKQQFFEEKLKELEES